MGRRLTLGTPTKPARPTTARRAFWVQATTQGETMTRKQLERLSDQIVRASDRLFRSHRASYKSHSLDERRIAECMENACGYMDRAVDEIARCLEIIEEREAELMSD